MENINDLNINVSYKARYLYVAWATDNNIYNWEWKDYRWYSRYITYTHTNICYISSDYVITDTQDILLNYGQISIDYD